MSTTLFDATFGVANTSPGTVNYVAAVGPATGALIDIGGTTYHVKDGLLYAYGVTGVITNTLEVAGISPLVDSSITLYSPRGSDLLWAPGLRMKSHADGAVGTGYFGYVSGSQVFLGRFSPTGADIFGPAVDVQLPVTSWTDPGGPLAIRFSATGNNPVQLRLEILRPDGTVVFDQTGSDTWSGGTGPGKPFLYSGGYNFGGTGDYIPISRILVADAQGSSPLVAGTLSLAAATAANVTLTQAPTTGGVLEAPTYGWQRSADGFATAGTTISGETGLSLTYAHSDRSIVYFRGVATDGVDTVYTNVLGACRQDPAIKVRLVGDSTTAGTAIPNRMKEILEKILGPVTVTVTNSAVNGSSTAQWVPGQTNFDTMLAAAVANGDEYADVTLGANDAAGGDVAAAKANMALTVAAIVAAGIKVVLNEPYYIRPVGAGGGKEFAFQAAWSLALDDLCNEVNVFRGVRNFQRYFANVAEAGRYNPGDAVHVSTLGAEDAADLRAGRLAQVIALRAAGAGSGSGTAPRRIGASRIRGGF